ncbi:hypothetical protein N8T08_000823 [Aspergillus melleus]|uniref:Uncharacterized protein n=1 Tax=Aspergillus melleus TaxID=138277 RepID=A0ACC3AP05_9EURO|nr:hypothetical protein N8T08_000823 [Aspergillus melleus]
MTASIIATCKQTRFHLLDDRPSQEVNFSIIDVEGLTIAVSSARDTTDDPAKSKIKGKARSKSEARELIADGHLRLKAALLRAMADKLVPGIPHPTRVAILQQTDSSVQGSLQSGEEENRDKTVLEYVMSSDQHKNDLVRKIDLLSKSFETDDPLQPVHAFRRVQHDTIEKRLFLAQKNAGLKSGARGLQARKDLKSMESKHEASLKLVQEENESIEAEAIKKDTQAAVETLQDLQSQFEAMNLVDAEQHARQILIGLGFQESALTKPFLTLSGGWRMRCMLASVLTQNPDIMILDEPTNFLDLLGVVWLENYLRQMRESSPTTMVLVSHDRDFVNAVCEEIVMIRDQKLSYFKGNLAAYEKDFEEQKLYWGRMKEAQERQISHMEATIRETMKVGKKTNDDNKLRMAKSRQKKIDDRMGLQVNANGGRFKLNRDLVGYHLSSRAEIEVPQDEKSVSMTIPDASELRFPGPLISSEGVMFRYKPNEPSVLNGIDLVIHMGDRVGIMGLNGCGKSTLVRLLTGNMVPSQGKISNHSRLKLGYYAQHSIEDLQEEGQADPTATALSVILKEADGQLNEGEARGLLATLALSDFYTVTALASALSIFSGAILLISHDRFLVRSVIEGKRDTEHTLDDDFEGVEEETEEEHSRRRVVYVLKAGKLQEQPKGVEQFEQSLVKRVQKMMPTQG